MFVCIRCKKGLMDPIRDEEEPEYTDRYRCGHCGHATTIASRLIVSTQILSAVLGGAITLYLLLDHLNTVLQGWQQGKDQPLLANVGLSLVASLLLIGFGYTLFRAVHNVYKRQRYLQAGR